jgi:signal recognition particle GTPase
MQELEKIKRVITKQNENAPHEVMLVLDGGAGQNAINQAKQTLSCSTAAARKVSPAASITDFP